MADRALDHEPIDYRYGEMEIDEQKATFNVFMGLTKWASIAIASLLLFLVVWFTTEAGPVTGLISGVVLFVLASWLLRKRNEDARPH